MITTLLATVSENSDAAANAAAGILLFVFIVIATLMSLLPGIIAQMRRHHNRAAIWIVTLLAGWTGVGWIIAMVWAFTNPPPRS
jgi:uncharacterized membrane protein YhaH (DUF805 family)